MAQSAQGIVRWAEQVMNRCKEQLRYGCGELTLRHEQRRHWGGELNRIFFGVPFSLCPHPNLPGDRCIWSQEALRCVVRKGENKP